MEHTIHLAALGEKLAPLAKTFKDGGFNNKVTQSIVFTIPEILAFHKAVEKAVVDSIGQLMTYPAPNKNFTPVDEPALCEHCHHGLNFHSIFAPMDLGGCTECDCQEFQSKSYMHVAEIPELEKLSPIDRSILWDMINYQPVYETAGVPFRVFATVRYNDNTYNWLKENLNQTPALDKLLADTFDENGWKIQKEQK